MTETLSDSSLTSFADHYGERGTPAREDFEAFKLEVMLPESHKEISLAQKQLAESH